MSTQTATRKPTEIQQAALYRVTVKATHEVFYLVRSDSDPNTWYELHFERDAWECRCPSVKPCKHQRALNELLRARQALKAEQVRQVEPTPEKLDGDDVLVSVTAAELIAQEMAKVEAQRAVEVELKSAVFAELKKCFDYRSAPAKVEPKPEKYVPIAERGSLNGSKAFSLMR